MTLLDVPDFPTGAQVQQYLENYANHFQLKSTFRLGTVVTGIHRSEKSERWIVSINGADLGATEEEFDKVIVTTGTFHSSVMPEVPGIEMFEGKVIHSQSFKE
jgi:dimethylaniline monooxygenase (N-oxide forming)